MSESRESINEQDCLPTLAQPADDPNVPEFLMTAARKLQKALDERRLRNPDKGGWIQ